LLGDLSFKKRLRSALLSHSLREVIPMIQLLDELKGRGFETYSSEPIIHCKCFEENDIFLEIKPTQTS